MLNTVRMAPSEGFESEATAWELLTMLRQSGKGYWVNVYTGRLSEYAAKLGGGSKVADFVEERVLRIVETGEPWED